MPTPNHALRAYAQRYNRYYGLPRITEGEYRRLNEIHARDIANAFDALPKVATDSRTRGCYGALSTEVNKQFEYLESLGYQLEPWTGEGQPYPDSKAMCADVKDNWHLYFFTGGEVHPHLGTQRDERGLTANDKFRAIHDIFGHAAEGYGFGPRGEDNAWRKHAQMFTPFARKAMTSETRGQNSWFNFGPHSHLPVTERPYAPQKAALLPDWAER